MTEEQKKAAQDAIKAILQSRQQQGGGGGGGQPQPQQDPNLKQPKGNQQDNQDSQSSSSSQSQSQQGKSKANNPNSNRQKGPTIGDQGNKDIQDKEEAERQANAYTDDSGEEVGQDKQDAQGKGKGQSGDKSDKQDGEGSGGGEGAEGDDGSLKPGDDGYIDPNKKRDAAQQARLDKINKAFSDARTGDSLTGEVQSNKEKAAAEKEKRDYDRKMNKYKSDPTRLFNLSLQSFVKKATGEERGPSWSRMNKKYSDSDLMKPGITPHANAHIPTINVYFDHSGSWGTQDIEVGVKAINNLQDYVKRGLLKIRVYYFADNIVGDPNDVQGATHAGPDIIKHLRDTKADNAIIMTDDDFDGQVSKAEWEEAGHLTLPGAVWFLFRRDECKSIQQYLRGRMQTQVFLLR